MPSFPHHRALAIFGVYTWERYKSIEEETFCPGSKFSVDVLLLLLEWKDEFDGVLRSDCWVDLERTQ